ncbi:hypothetical protein MKZ38_005692 [Zalerion maritima]|uniref:CDP-diacylglycerol--serine O-phosphatidyltransferase n=1 Tax=Zalerion maritima TaxID=339359 RepID=A0AAD5WQT8_9PEZI|nr:hypothetical protein MKZ38_005692 [Zalerion maritima]
MSRRPTTRAMSSSMNNLDGSNGAASKDPSVTDPLLSSSAPKSPALEDESTKAKMQSAHDKQTLLLSGNTGHFSLIRALHLADFITEMNGFCGVMSIFSSLKYCLGDPADHAKLYWALAFLPFGLFFDFMDGKVARWRKKSSMMGQELDSLADLISFGIAPAVVGFSLGLRSTIDQVGLAFFVLCGLTRLARFNVTAQIIPKDASGKAHYFEGTPIPTSLGMDSIMAWWIYNGWVLDNVPLGVVGAGTAFEFHPIVAMFMAHGCLMTSRSLKIPKP